MSDFELVDQSPLCRIHDLQGRPTRLEGHHSSVTFALDGELFLQTQSVSIERHRLVEILGLYHETQLLHYRRGSSTAHRSLQCQAIRTLRLG
jgi:hypothetical protein